MLIVKHGKRLTRHMLDAIGNFLAAFMVITSLMMGIYGAGWQLLDKEIFCKSVIFCMGAFGSALFALYMVEIDNA